MAATTVCSDFGAQENKACHCFHLFPIYLPWSDGTRCHDLRFLNVEFKPVFHSPLSPSSRGYLRHRCELNVQETGTAEKRGAGKGRFVGNVHSLRTGRGTESGWKSGPERSGMVKNWKGTSSVEPSERVTGRKARGLQMEEIACKCQTFLSLLSGRRKQTSDIFSFSIQI